MSVLKRPEILTFAVILTLFCLACPAFSQTPVNLAPYTFPQFFDGTGKILSGGFLYTYSAGTNTRLDTYTDSTGVILNAWPIPLDATGAPSNGSTQTGIWLTGNAYKFCLYSSAMVLQKCVDNIQPTPFLAGNNAWTGTNTFAGTSTFNAAVILNSGGTFTGSIAGAPAFTGAPTFSGGPTFTTVSPVFSILGIFNAGLNTDAVNGITAGSTMTFTSASGVGLNPGEGMTFTTGTGSVAGGISFVTGNSATGNGAGFGVTLGNAPGNAGSFGVTTGNSASAGHGGDISFTSGNGFGARGGNLSFITGSGTPGGTVTFLSIGPINLMTTGSASPVNINSGIVSTGSPSLTGCTLSAATGGQWAGSFTSGTTGTCTVQISLSDAAPHGWWCQGNDITGGHIATLATTGSTINSCTISGSTTSGDGVNWVAFGF